MSEIEPEDVEVIYSAWTQLHHDNPDHPKLRALLERLGRLEPVAPRPPTPGQLLLMWARDLAPFDDAGVARAIEEVLDVAMNVLEYEALLVLEEERNDAPHREHARAMLRTWCEKLRDVLGAITTASELAISSAFDTPACDAAAAAHLPALVPVPLADTLGARIRSHRRAAGKTMLDMAIALECGVAHWSSIEHDEIAPSLAQVQQIVRALLGDATWGPAGGKAEADRLYDFLMDRYPIQPIREADAAGRRAALADELALLGPDSFGGDDSESHYAAPAAMRELREARITATQAPRPSLPPEPVGEESVVKAAAPVATVTSIAASYDRARHSRKGWDDPSEEAALLAEPEPEPSLIPLGQLEGVLNETEAALVRGIARYTGWVPVIRLTHDASGKVVRCVVCYQFVAQWDESKQPRTRSVEAPEATRHDEKLLWVLREIARMVHLEHRKDAWT